MKLNILIGILFVLFLCNFVYGSAVIKSPSGGLVHNPWIDEELTFLLNSSVVDGEQCVLQRNVTPTVFELIGSSHTVGVSRMNDYVGHWEQPDGDDHSGFGITFTNSAENVSGVRGNGFGFNGTDAHITSTAFQLANSNTVMFWFREFSRPSTYGLLFSESAAPTGRIQRYGDAIRIYDWGHADNDFISSVGVFTLGDWHHLTLTFDNETGNMSLYHNGEYIDSNVILNKTVSFPNSAKWSGTYTNLASDINGTTDEYKIFNYSLSPEEIREEYERRAFFYLNDNTSAENVFSQTLNGTINGNPTLEYSDYFKDNVMVFNGKTDAVTVSYPYNPVNTTGFTIYSWVIPLYNPTDGGRIISTQANNAELFVKSHNTSHFMARGYSNPCGGYTSGLAYYPWGVPIYMSMSWNSTHELLRVNGVRAMEETHSSCVFPEFTIMAFGKYTTLGQNAYNGSIYGAGVEAAFWNDSESLEHFNGSKSIRSRAREWNVNSTDFLYPDGTTSETYTVTCNKSYYGGLTQETDTVNVSINNTADIIRVIEYNGMQLNASTLNIQTTVSLIDSIVTIDERIMACRMPMFGDSYTIYR